MAGKFSENTLMPVSFIIVLLGLSFWFTTMYWQGAANAKDIEELTKEQKTYNENLYQIKNDIRLIKIKLRIRDEH